MKKIILLLFIQVFYTCSFSQFPSPDLVFKIINIQHVSTNNMIVTGRHDNGRTIQFSVSKTALLGIKNTNQLELGTYIVADFTAGTVSPISFNSGKNSPINYNVKYNLTVPDMPKSNYCCTISNLENLVSFNPTTVSIFFISAKKDTANGVTYFIDSVPIIFGFGVNFNPPAHVRLGQAIYQAHYNNKRYAVLKDPTNENKYISLSYEFRFMTNDAYNNLSRSSFNIPPEQPEVSPTTQKLNTNAPDNKFIKPEVSNITPIENGYESVQIFARINNDEEMEVRVNGKVVGKYSQTVKVNMDNFLKRNAINVISFKFNDEAKSSSYVELSGKFPGDGEFTPIYNFIPKTSKTEGQFEVPFASKNK